MYQVWHQTADQLEAVKLATSCKICNLVLTVFKTMWMAQLWKKVKMNIISPTERVERTEMAEIKLMNNAALTFPNLLSTPWNRICPYLEIRRRRSHSALQRWRHNLLRYAPMLLQPSSGQAKPSQAGLDHNSATCTNALLKTLTTTLEGLSLVLEMTWQSSHFKYSKSYLRHIIDHNA